jgi:hypothetical protein
MSTTFVNQAAAKFGVLASSRLDSSAVFFIDLPVSSCSHQHLQDCRGFGWRSFPPQAQNLLQSLRMFTPRFSKIESPLNPQAQS